MNMHKLFKGLVILALLPILPTGGPMPMRAAPKSVESTAPAIVESAGVELSPGYSQDAAPGSVVTYTHVLTNTGTTTDTFALDATSSQGWPASLLSVTGTLNLPLQLNAGLTTTFLISLSVPTVAVSGTVDTALLAFTALPALGFEGVSHVRVGRLVELEAESDEELADLCEKLLANPLIEDYEVLTDPEAAQAPSPPDA